MKKVVLVTGAAQGLGAEICAAFYAQNYKVVVSDVNLQLAEKTALSLDNTGQDVIAMTLDVMQKTEFSQALRQTSDYFGRCDVLINNAAITPTTPVLEISPEEFSQVVDVNLRGTFLGCQVFGEHFAAQGQGRIINLASLAGQMGGTAAGAHYASSKAGITTLTKIFARQFAASGVTVNAIAPGPVDVPSVRDKVPAEKLEHIINSMIPVKAMSEPGYIAKMAVMLAADDAYTVTGATWDINGGIYMR